MARRLSLRITTVSRYLIVPDREATEEAAPWLEFVPSTTTDGPSAAAGLRGLSPP